MSDEILGLAGVLVWTTPERYPAMREFYVERLGMVPRHDRELFVNFQWGEPPDDRRLTISVHPEIEGGTQEPLRLMVNLLVDDIHVTADRLRANGIEFSRPPEQEAWGGWVATCQDPDGNTVQLLQPAA